MTNFNAPSPTTSKDHDQFQRPTAPAKAQVVTPSPESPLFTDNGMVSAKLQQFLLSLPAPDPEKADKLSLETYAELGAGNLSRSKLNTYLQETVFKKNAGKFSYELSGTPPTETQLTLLSELGFRGEVRVAPGTDFDTAIVWGGTLAAVESRINTLLEQNVNFSRVVLLGTNKRELDKGEKTHVSETQHAMEAFLKRANERTGRNFIPTSYPTTESEMMAFAWEALKPSALESLPAITIDTPGRTPDHLLAKYKHVPGTADTFGYLLLFAQANGIDLGTRFIAASSQPHVLRQTVDAEFKLLSVDYPFDLLAGIGRANEGASLTLYLQEIAKLVNTQHRIAISDVLHSQHPDIVDAVSVLTVGSAKPGTAFRQPADFELKKPSGSSIGGKAGDYILVFKAPEGIEINSELINSILESGIPNKDYWISIIDGEILHSSYSTFPQSEQVIGAEGLAFNEAHAVYKAAGLKQKAHIPSDRQGEVRSLESERTGTNQSVDPNELVLIDIEGNPYPKWASQFVTQFKPDPEDTRSERFFSQVKARYGRWL